MLAVEGIVAALRPESHLCEGISACRIGLGEASQLDEQARCTLEQFLYGGDLCTDLEKKIMTHPHRTIFF